MEQHTTFHGFPWALFPVHGSCSLQSGGGDEDSEGEQSTGAGATQLHICKTVAGPSCGKARSLETVQLLSPLCIESGFFSLHHYCHLCCLNSSSHCPCFLQPVSYSPSTHTGLRSSAPALPLAVTCLTLQLVSCALHPIAPWGASAVAL